ncbi:MAG: hypothetical protein ABR589_12995, partial [Chthoniobacterales bacterium]
MKRHISRTRLFVVLMCGTFASFTLLGEEPASRSVRITFLPPPIEGTISLGIYDPAGKLLRVLHRESEIEEFEIGSDALGTTWDGKNDAGEAMPSGKYYARGYAVGDLEIAGVGFHFNDWVSDDGLHRVLRICGITAEGDDLVASARLNSGEAEIITCDSTGTIIVRGPVAAESNCDHDISSATTERPIA